MKVLVAQLCLTFFDPMDCAPPGSSVHGILQARIQAGSHSLLQGIFLIQGLNLGLLHCKQSPGKPSDNLSLLDYPIHNNGGFLQYWASLVAQLVKKLPAMWAIWVQFLGWEDALEKGKVTHSSILAWKIPWTV